MQVVRQVQISLGQHRATGAKCKFARRVLQCSNGKFRSIKEPLSRRFATACMQGYITQYKKHKARLHVNAWDPTYVP
eukprot:1141667-Pelagomonas_calceolata.AAC.4